MNLTTTRKPGSTRPAVARRSVLYVQRVAELTGKTARQRATTTRRRSAFRKPTIPAPFKRMARRAIAEAHHLRPDLGGFGACAARDGAVNPLDVEAVHPLDVEQVATCIAFIQRGPVAARKSRGSTSTYGWKHLAERWGGAMGFCGYVTNGAFICACLYLRVPLGPQHGPNHWPFIEYAGAP